MFMERDDDDDADFTGVDIENHSIRLPRALLGRLANGSSITVASSFYRNMKGLLPGNLPTGDG